MHSLCIAANLHIAVNNMKLLTVAMGIQEWVTFALLLSYKIFCTAVNNVNILRSLYRVSHELRSLLRESVPYVKIYRYNPKHLCPKLNGYGDNGQRSLKL